MRPLASATRASALASCRGKERVGSCSSSVETRPYQAYRGVGPAAGVVIAIISPAPGLPRLGQNLKHVPEGSALRDGQGPAGFPANPADSHSNPKSVLPT